MNLQVESFGEVKVVPVKEGRLIYPDLSTFSAEISQLLEAGVRKLIINLCEVSYLGSASYICPMDTYRMMSKQNGTVKLVGLQEGVEAMGSLVGLTRLIESFCEEEPFMVSSGTSSPSTRLLKGNTCE